MNKTTTPKAEGVASANPNKVGGKSTSLWRQWWFWLLMLAVAGGGYYFFTKPEATQQQSGKSGRGGLDRPIPVSGVAAKLADVDVYLNGLGTVTPMNVTVRARVDGQLMRVLFREGQMVKAGDLLAEIDPRPFQVQLTQAEGQLARDQALLKNAQLDLERYRTLFAQDSIAKQQVDTQAALVRQYEGTIKADQGQIESAKLQLTYSRITAPISGRLGLRQIDPGNIVHATDQNGLVVIAQLQPVDVVFAVPEDSVPSVMKKLRANEKLPVDAYDRDGQKKLASGLLLTADNQIDATTGTIKLKARFQNDDDSLFSNQFVNARMLVDVRRGTTVIPSAAIQRGTQGTYVYLAKPDKTVTVRVVKLGPVQGEKTAIDTGLSPGDMVVVDGTDKLREGAKVELVTKEAGVPKAGEQLRQRSGRRNAGGEK
ncbi:MAG: MdtA/MuxA family multidrug efflux RND transporter periplasmic adaptor subunit [Pseudomonadota bacterium]